MSNEATPEQNYLFAIDCLRLLSAPWSVQERILSRSATADEVALAYDDIRTLMTDVSLVEKFSASALAAMFGLGNAIDALQNDPANWRGVSLRDGAGWALVREAALAVLHAQNEGWEAPRYQGNFH